MSKLWLFNNKYLHPWQDPDCKGYWALEEASGDRADKTVNANTLTDNNTVLQGTGIKGNCADFEASTSEYLSRTHAAQVGLGFDADHSCFCWIKPESAGGDLIVKAPPALTTGYSMYFAATNLLSVTIGNGSAFTQLQFTIEDNPGQWMFVGYVYDEVGAGTSIINIYVNGRLVATTSSAVVLSAGTNNFYLGYTNSAGYYDGLMDEACCFNRLLTPNDVLWLYLYGLQKVGGGNYKKIPQIKSGLAGLV